MAERVMSRGAGRGPPLGSTSARAPHHSHGLRRFARRGLAAAGRRFRVATTEALDTGAPVVSVQGEVDVATVLALEQALLGVTEDRTDDVIVDLTGCSFLDSRGIGALNAARARPKRSERRLGLVLANQSVLRIFQITRFDWLFEIYPSLRAAVDGDANSDGSGHGIADESAGARSRRVPATTTDRVEKRAPAHLAPAGASR
jgi:anti-sigma B factor antagonist